MKLRSGNIWLGGAVVAGLAIAALLLWRPAPPPAEHRPVPPLVPLKLSELQASPPAGVDLRDDVLSVLDGTLTFQERIDIAASLAGEMSEWECDALIAALLKTPPPGVPAGPHSTWFHFVGSVLQSQPDCHERFARALVAIARQPSRELVYRDYAVQHLRLVWEGASGEPEFRASIVRSLGNLVEDPALGASALLALHTLGSPQGEKPFHLPDEDLIPLIGPVLSDPQGDLTRRLAALRAVGDRGIERFRPELRRIAADEAGSHALARMAAIASLSRFDDPADRPFLEALPADDPRIASSVRSALARPATSSR